MRKRQALQKQYSFTSRHPIRVILSEAKDLGGVRREVYKHYFVGRCLGAAALMGLNRSSRREQAPALPVWCVYRMFYLCRLLRVVGTSTPTGLIKI